MTRRYGADAVYVAHSPRLGFLLSVIACLKPIRLLVCEHQSHDSLRSRVYRKLRVWTYRRAALVCLTPRDRSFFASHGLRAFQVQNFVSPSLAPFAPRDLDKRLIYVGRLDIPQKAVDRMLRIIMASGLLREGYEMVFAGEGAAHELLQREAAKSPDAERIRFLPFSKNVKGLYGQGAVFLLTSNYEGFPLCLIEAMSQGLPCVAFDCDSGPRDVIVDGVNGYLIPLDDEASFVKAIRCATDSAASYAALSSGAVGTAGRYTIARSCEQWLSAMRGIGYAA
jgi:glycosyltransferase involved in cell wall biosynthesis